MGGFGAVAGTLLASCGRSLAKSYPGFLYVARRDQRSLAVIDLEQFRWAGKVELPSPPQKLLKVGNQLVAICPATASIYFPRFAEQRADNPIRLPSPPDDIIASADSPESAFVLSAAAAQVFRIDLRNRRVAARAQLQSAPAGSDCNRELLAVSEPGRRAVHFLHAQTLQQTAIAEVGHEPQIVRFRMDGKTLLAGVASEKQVVTIDVASGAILTRLAVPVCPEHFCFNSDGGQMFVSGSGADVVAIVGPYQNEVEETILAGRTPGEMLVPETQGGPNLLLVSNPEAGDLTMIDIDTRMLSASVHVGQRPGQVLVTPNGEFVLVLNQQSGDVAAIRLKTVLNHKNKTKPLFTVVPVGAQPVSAVIMPHSRV